MANSLETMTAAQVRTFVDSLHPGDTVSVTWSSATVPHPQVWPGSVLAVDAVHHIAQISYPEYGVHAFPPTHACVLHTCTASQHTDPWAAAIRAKSQGKPSNAPDHLVPTSWEVFVGGTTDGEHALRLLQFQSWLRGRHGLTAVDHSQKGDFHAHSRVCLVRSLEQWVAAAQLNTNWRHVANIAIAEELLAALERYTLFGMGASLTAFGSALDSGKTVKEAFATSSAKKA